MLAKAVCQAMERLSVPTPSRASFAPTDFCRTQRPVYAPNQMWERACSRKRCVRRWRGCLCRRLREQALLLQIFCRTQSPCTPKSNVGASLLAKAVCQAMEMLSAPSPSRASFAPTDILSNTKPVYTQLKCGSKLCSYRFLSNTKPGHTPNQMWERACSRKQSVRR